ncbi:MAG TPA: hypothetical protein VHV77_15065 [Pirellulales bacterium]|jgi:hypothetical protein|nr:hypothetical protein [Pirellulales bacterium]
MRKLLMFAWLLFVSAFGMRLVADEPLKTTTEFGITITPNDLSEAIQETQDFWEPVLHYLGTSQFESASDADARKQIVAFFTGMHEGFYERLFEGDDANVNDLVDYLGLRLRKFMMYRQLRELISDDTVLAQLIERWERANRDINALALGDRPARVAAVLAQMSDEMKAVGVSEVASLRALEIWELQTQCFERMAETGTGAMMIVFERKARQMDRSTGEVIRQIASAADWATVKKARGKSLGLDEFKAAWSELGTIRANRLTMTKPAARQ